MLETHRERYFFTEDPETIVEYVREFAQSNDGEPEQGGRNLCIYRFADPAGGRRFLTMAVRTNDDESDVEGKITLRWRDEPDGRFAELEDNFCEAISEQYDLLSLPEARKRKKGE